MKFQILWNDNGMENMQGSVRIRDMKSSKKSQKKEQGLNIIMWIRRC